MYVARYLQLFDGDIKVPGLFEEDRSRLSSGDRDFVREQLARLLEHVLEGRADNATDLLPFLAPFSENKYVGSMLFLIMQISAEVRMSTIEGGIRKMLGLKDRKNQ